MKLTRNKLLTLALALFFAAVPLLGCGDGGLGGGGGGKGGFQEYAEAEAFRFYAYMTPPPANVGSDGDLVSNPDYMTPQQYAWIDECGFNYAVPIYEKSMDDHLKTMDGLEPYGIGYFPIDGSAIHVLGNVNGGMSVDAPAILEGRAKMEINIAEYKKRTNFAGLYLSDEPSTADFPGIKAAADFLHEIAGPEYEAWVNVHPNSVPPAYVQATDYMDYISRYARETGISRVSFDSYALFENGGLRSAHFANLAQIAAVAKANDMRFDSFILTMGHHTYRTPDNYDDIAWQIYASMAFGASGIQTFTYWTTMTHGENVTYGLVDHYGNRTQVWYSMQEVIKEVKAFEKMYMNSEWKGVLRYSADGDYNDLLDTIADEIEPYAGEGAIPVALDGYPRIANMKANRDFMMGVFEDKDGRDAFLLCNISDPDDDLDNTVTLKFNNATKAVIYKKGRKVMVNLKNGTFTTKIGSGEGYYIIPLE
ncbi:MAG: hypothetical protein FWE62_01450 [Firmicutes bacterium]|nr:hypothetical protein [Bacillota bacterium]